MGTVLAQLGQRACPTWARCLPRMGRFDVRGLPNKFMLQHRYFCFNPYRSLDRSGFNPNRSLGHSGFKDSADTCNSSHLDSRHLTIPLIWANHPDSSLTVARWPTVCLSEYYNKKPDNLTVSTFFVEWDKEVHVFFNFIFNLTLWQNLFRVYLMKTLGVQLKLDTLERSTMV